MAKESASEATNTPPLPRRPKWAVGAKVTTRHPVKVPKRVFRRRWLYLIPGTEWLVTAVESDGKRTPWYTLTCGGYEIRRQEWRLRPLGDETAAKKLRRAG